MTGIWIESGMTGSALAGSWSETTGNGLAITKLAKREATKIKQYGLIFPQQTDQ